MTADWSAALDEFERTLTLCSIAGQGADDTAAGRSLGDASGAGSRDDAGGARSRDDASGGIDRPEGFPPLREASLPEVSGPCPAAMQDRARALLADARKVEGDLQARIEAVRAELRRLPRAPGPAAAPPRFETRA